MNGFGILENVASVNCFGLPFIWRGFLLSIGSFFWWLLCRFLVVSAAVMVLLEVQLLVLVADWHLEGRRLQLFGCFLLLSAGLQLLSYVFVLSFSVFCCSRREKGWIQIARELVD